MRQKSDVFYIFQKEIHKQDEEKVESGKGEEKEGNRRSYKQQWLVARASSEEAIKLKRYRFRVRALIRCLLYLARESLLAIVLPPAR